MLGDRRQGLWVRDRSCLAMMEAHKLAVAWAVSAGASPGLTNLVGNNLYAHEIDDPLADETMGLKVAAVGFFIAIAGGTLVFSGQAFGGWIVDLGILLSLLGVVLHFIKNWRSIFRGNQ